ELIRGLASERYELYLAIPGEPTESTKIECKSLGVKWQNIPMGWWNRKIRLDWTRRIAWATAQNVNTLANLRTIHGLTRCIRGWNIDLVHTHTGLNPWGAIAAKLTGVHHVWHIHEPNGNNQPFRYWLPDRLFANTLTHLSDYVVCVSNYVAEIFKSYQPCLPVEAVYQGIDLSRYSRTPECVMLRQALGIEKDEVVVGMVAGLSSMWKRHDLFVRMAGNLVRATPKVRFVVFGDFPSGTRKWLYNSSSNYADSIRRLVVEQGLANQFVFAGYHSNASAVMNAIDILVHPCEFEGFGRVAIEAMAAGKPVVGPNKGGVAESVVDGDTGLLFPAGDLDVLTAFCQRLIANPGLRTQMGKNGRARVAANFTLEA